MYYLLLLRDTIEIAFYSFIIYSLCIWLKTDRTKNILAYFLLYCSITLMACYCELPTLAPFLCTYAPIATMLFIILHEKTLQRNLVTLQNITPVHTQEHDWLDTLLSSTLSLMNNNKSITIIIENKDSLDYFLTTPLLINANLCKGILNILLSSSSYDEKKMVWISSHGSIKGINASWQEETTQQSLLVHKTDFNKKDALFYTLQSDAIILYLHPHIRTFTMIINGKEIQHISMNEIKNSINKHLALPAFIKNKGTTHENSSSKDTFF